MSDELLERLDAGPTTIQAWANECYTDAAARIRALQSDNQAQAARIAELEDLVTRLIEWTEREHPEDFSNGLHEALQDQKELRAAEKEE